jgi:hypothetical protein
MNIQNNDITLANYEYYVQFTTNKLYPPNCWYDTLMYKKACS